MLCHTPCLYFTSPHPATKSSTYGAVKHGSSLHDLPCTWYRYPFSHLATIQTPTLSASSTYPTLPLTPSSPIPCSARISLHGTGNTPEVHANPRPFPCALALESRTYPRPLQAATASGLRSSNARLHTLPTPVRRVRPRRLNYTARKLLVSLIPSTLASRNPSHSIPLHLDSRPSS